MVSLHPLLWRSVCQTTTLSVSPFAWYLTAILFPVLATTVPSHQLYALLFPGQRTLTSVPGPSFRAIGWGIRSVGISCPVDAASCFFSSLVAVPAYLVHIHWVTPLCLTSYSGSLSSSHFVFVTTPLCQSPDDPPNDFPPDFEHIKVLILVPLFGIHQPVCPVWVFACSNLIGAASCTSTHSHCISVIVLCSLVLFSSASSARTLDLTFLTSAAASSSAMRTIHPSETMGR